MRRFIYRFICGLLIIVMGVSLCPIVSLSAKTANPLSLKKTQKILYIGGCRGVTVSGKKAGFLAHTNVRKLINGFDVKKYDITLKSANVLVASADSVNDCIYAEGIGETTVSVTVKDRENGKKVLKSGIKIIVRQNADKHSFIVEGIDLQKSLYDGDSLIISMPGTYTDKRVVICEDEGAEITPLEDGKSFEITFFDPGDYAILAAAYQSEKYNGYTAEKEFDVVVKEREAELHQTSADSVKLTGGPADGDMEASEISVYEINDGIKVFYSYASKLSMDAHEAEICFFKPFASEKDYVLEYDGLEFPFTSAPCTVNDVASFEIVENEIQAKEETQLSFTYYNINGLDITKSVYSQLDYRVRVELETDDLLKAYFVGRKLCIPETGSEVKIHAHLEIDAKSSETESRLLETTGIVKAVAPKGTIFKGKMIFTVKTEDDHYLKPDDELKDEVPLGDEVVFEALFEMEDGSFKTLKQAGITSLLVGDQKILMVGSQTGLGGYNLILNCEGTVGIVALKGDTPVGNCEITVLPRRKASELKVELSKDHLNTNMYTDDYILIKADLYDQYGDVIEAEDFEITQSELGKKTVGDIKFNHISKGRFLVNGWECQSGTEAKTIVATLKSGSFLKEIKFFVRDVSYNPKEEGYSYCLKTDGSRIIDNAVLLGHQAPKSTFITVEISKDGYYVGEGIGFWFDKLPSVQNGADYYGINEGESLYGITVEYISADGEKEIVSETECIVSSYMEIEFIPYSFQKKLRPGIYDITVYQVTTGKGYSQIKECDSLSLRVVDTDPEIEVIQLLQTYSGKTEENWENEIGKYFSFKFDGEDVSEYITKVDCVEGSTGNVFVRSVDFLIPNPYFGAFTKTVNVERLITKQ